MDPDLQILTRDVALGRLPEPDLRRVYEELDQMAVPSGTTVTSEQDPGDGMYFVLEGVARASRHGLQLRALGPGDHFGALALVGSAPHAETVIAEHPLRLAVLSHGDYARLATEAPETARRLLEALLATVSTTLVTMTDNLIVLLGDRSLPRRTDVTVTIGSETRTVATGTVIRNLLPAEIAGELVVACLLDSRPVSLRTPVVSDARLEPLTLGSSDGREVFRRSAGLLLLEAANRVLPDRDVRLGAALDTAQPIDVDLHGEDVADVCHRLGHMVQHLIEQRIELREELWTVEEARAELALRGWPAAAAMLDTWREATVPLVTAGTVYALRTEPVVLDAGVLDGIGVATIAGNGLVLTYGPRGSHRLVKSPSTESELAVEAQVPRWGGEMVREQEPWRVALGVTSVGMFNRSCVSGRVVEIIRVAEGFHEKRLGRLADLIAARRNELRVISIAGPSSSGKTTLIKRLITQLEVVGMRPHALSLDDYYVDRTRTPRDEGGEYDFEALEALDLAMLQDQFRRMLAGERVRTPRYDFKLGVSQREAGPEMTLGAGEVLLLEGIHGLNPALLGDSIPAAQQFRVFIHPATALPIDRLSRVSPYDLRLLRRIVRDRHTRNIAAAENIMRWPSVRRGEVLHIYPYLPNADAVFDSSLIYEPAVIKVFAERYLLEVPPDHPSHVTAHRLRQLVDRFVAIYPDHVPPTSILREFIGGSGFEY